MKDGVGDSKSPYGVSGTSLARSAEEGTKVNIPSARRWVLGLRYFLRCEYKLLARYLSQICDLFIAPVHPRVNSCSIVLKTEMMPDKRSDLVGLHKHRQNQ